VKVILMLLALPFLMLIVAWLATASLRKKGQMTAGTQRCLLILMATLAVASLALQWWDTVRHAA